MWFAEFFQQFKKKYATISKILAEYTTPSFFISALVFSLAAILVAYFLAVIGVPIAFGLVGVAVLSLVGAGISSALRWLTTDVFGWSLSDPAETIYEDAPKKLNNLLISKQANKVEEDKISVIFDENDPNSITCQYKSATATLSVKGNNTLPKLTLKADNHEDSGYLEGYMQGEQIFMTLNQMNKVFGKIELVIKLKQFFGINKSDEELEQYFDEMFKNIPAHIVTEMKAKVSGYNQWVADKGLPEKNKMTIYQYFKWQLLPDIHNFNPFVKEQGDSLFGAELASTGCTSIAYKVGDYTCYIRILDWASHDIAGKACIEIEREILNYRKTSDVAIGLLSGGVSMVTHSDNHQMLTQINVAPVDPNKKNRRGMPGSFAIRYVAENCGDVEQMKNMVTDNKDNFFNNGPLSGMHISATDGDSTISFHAYQGGEDAIHLIEEMDDSRPMVVANFGHKNGEIFDFHDSRMRLENINGFFKQNPVNNIPLQQTDTHNENIKALEEHMHGIMQLNLVNNCESVFAGVYIFYQGQIVDAKAAIDNNYAGSRSVDQWMSLSIAS